MSRYDAATALVVVDMQNDFADPAGSLFVVGGDAIVATINDEIAAAQSADATVVFTQDWHPAATAHFEPDGQWPVHCVGGTWGAKLVSDLSPHADAVIRKGTGGEDGYSGFSVRDPLTNEVTSTGLGGLLHDRGIARVVVVGLAADVCVSATALDAARLGFTTSVLWDATRPVFSDAATDERMMTDFEAANVTVVGRRVP